MPLDLVGTTSLVPCFDHWDLKNTLVICGHVGL